MIKIVRRSTPRAASRKWLADRVGYIADAEHSRHKDKKDLLPPKNYNCPDQSPEAFIEEVIGADQDYRIHRDGKPGKITRRIFEELVYSSEPQANYTPLECEEIEALLVKLLGRYTPCRASGHLDNKKRKTKRTDIHILFAAKNRDFPPVVVLWSLFGGTGGKHIHAELDRMDAKIVAMINRGRPVDKHVKSKPQRRRENALAKIGRKPALAAEIAAKTNGLTTHENLAVAIESLGYTVRQQTAQYIAVVFAQGKAALRKKPRRFTPGVLLREIERQRCLLREKRRKGLAQDEPPPP